MTPRKLLTIICDSGIEQSMLELLEGLGVPGLTRIEHVLGRGASGPKENSPVFPGTNHVILVSLPESEVEGVRVAIRALQNAYRLRPGVTLLLQDVWELD